MTVVYEIQTEHNKELSNYIAEQVRAHKYQTGSQYFNEDGDPKNLQVLNVILNDDTNMLIGALTGATFFGAYAIRWLWVHENYRHQGYAREMINRAIDVAVERGCTFAYGDTWEIQGAHTLYDKLGAQVIMRMDNFPLGSALTRYRLNFDDWSTGENRKRGEQ